MRGSLRTRRWAETTLLPAPERVAVRRSTGWLPSRAADNLFWVGRYIERAEATLRIVRAVVNRSADLDVEFAPIVDRLAALLAAWDAVPDGLLAARPALIARAALQGGQLGGSLPRLVASARYAASVIRDRFSPDAWRAINRLVAVAETPLPEGAGEDVLFQRVDDALRIVASFSGLAQENMTQLAGWRFLELGRRVERGHHHLPVCARLRVAAGRRPCPGHAARTDRQPDHLPAGATSWWRREPR